MYIFEFNTNRIFIVYTSTYSTNQSNWHVKNTEITSNDVFSIFWCTCNTMFLDIKHSAYNIIMIYSSTFCYFLQNTFLFPMYSVYLIVTTVCTFFVHTLYSSPHWRSVKQTGGANETKLGVPMNKTGCANAKLKLL